MIIGTSLDCRFRHFRYVDDTRITWVVRLWVLFNLCRLLSGTVYLNVTWMSLTLNSSSQFVMQLYNHQQVLYYGIIFGTLVSQTITPMMKMLFFHFQSSKKDMQVENVFNQLLLVRTVSFAQLTSHWTMLKLKNASFSKRIASYYWWSLENPEFQAASKT